jgi:hypothetical protein
VIRSRTVLGNVSRRWEHVHLTEIRGTCVVNPLSPGHLEPYRDLSSPTVTRVSFFTPGGKRMSGRRLHGLVEAVAQAQDTPAMLGSGPWRRMPVAPALVGWELTTLRGAKVASGTTVDFRTTEPPPQDFCRVYAQGTTQNFPAEPGRYEWGRPGRYLFRLTPLPFDTRMFPNGTYRLTVTAADTARNRGRRIVLVTIDNRGAVRAGPGVPPDWRCLSRALTVDRVRAFRHRHSEPEGAAGRGW